MQKIFSLHVLQQAWYCLGSTGSELQCLLQCQSSGRELDDRLEMILINQFSYEISFTPTNSTESEGSADEHHCYSFERCSQTSFVCLLLYFKITFPEKRDTAQVKTSCSYIYYVMWLLLKNVALNTNSENICISIYVYPHPYLYLYRYTDIFIYKIR